MPAMTVSPVSSSVVTRNVGSSRHESVQGLAEPSAPSRLTGLIAILMTGSATNMLSSVQYFGSRRVRVAAGGIDAHHGDDIAGLGAVDLLALVGVHLARCG